jgi:Peptidase A4 family
VHFGRFAGYAQVGPVIRSVAATLTVPRVTNASSKQLALASTWVGAEALGTAGDREPFVQVGIEAYANAPGYEAFWSDTARGGVVSDLFTVHAGDRVSASLTLSQRHWTIVIGDGAAHRRIVVAAPGTAKFQLALWCQEDEAYNHPNVMVYPRVRDVRFSDLAVDGRAPESPYLNPVWMSAGKTVFEPGGMRDDAFTLLPGQATVSAAAARQADKISRSYYAIYKPQRQLAGATSATRRAELTDWVSEASEALIKYEHSLRRQQWPSKARASVNALLSVVQAQLSLTRQLMHLAGTQFTAWQTRFSASTATIQIAVARLTHSLELPWSL